MSGLTITNDKKYIRANKDLPTTHCKNCQKEIIKQHGFQIVYYCSKKCRREFKER